MKCVEMETYSTKEVQDVSVSLWVKGGMALLSPDYLSISPIHYISNTASGFTPISTFLGSYGTLSRGFAVTRDINNRIKYYIGHFDSSSVHPVKYSLVVVNKYKDDRWKMRRELIFITLDCKKLADLVGYQYASEDSEYEFTQEDINACLSIDYTNLPLDKNDLEEEARAILDEKVTELYRRERLISNRIDTFEEFITAFCKAHSKETIDDTFEARVRDHLIELTNIRDLFTVDSLLVRG
jgi:hypothetical protein